MTQTQAPGRVVAATDGTTAGTIGVRYAAREAQRRGVGLELKHVVPAFLPVGTFPMMPDDSFQQFGRDVLQQGVATAREVDPEANVKTTLHVGGRVASIVAHAHDAGVIVLGSHPLVGAERFWSGPTVPGVAARASCPVIAVPEDYDETKSHGRVVVGVKRADRSAELLAAAFAIADELGAELLVVHAWKLPSGYDDLVSNKVARAEWRQYEMALMKPDLATLQTQYPNVVTRVEIMHGLGAAALIEASKEADRLVISRPAHGSYFHHLGATARAVLREAQCPVEVIPPTSNRHHDDTESERRVENPGYLVG
jgi:nucleotide-binding universal stress UspA family protein